jgi:hypothetical protein
VEAVVLDVTGDFEHAVAPTAVKTRRVSPSSATSTVCDFLAGHLLDGILTLQSIR